MLYIVRAPNERHEPDPTLSAIISHGETALKLVQDQPDHPNADLAVHIMDLYTAAARAAARSDETSLDMGQWQFDLSHLCETHTYAAIFLLAATAPNSKEGAVSLACQGLSAVRQLLEQQ